MNPQTGTEALNKLRHKVLTMATLVEENLGKALAALRANDAGLAREVAEDDAAVDAMQIEIEDMAAILIATRQPVARDLRELVAVFKITGNLERAGDHAAHLAKSVIKFSEKEPFYPLERLERMTQTGREMIRASIGAYLNQDADAARKAAALDDKIDSEHKALTEELLGLMKERPKLVKQAVRVLNTSNQLERLGDHVTNICEGIIYMVECKREELNE
jgi:phosphate transport system protein